MIDDIIIALVHIFEHFSYYKNRIITSYIPVIGGFLLICFGISILVCIWFPSLLVVKIGCTLYVLFQVCEFIDEVNNT